MKSRILLAGGFFVLALLSQPFAKGQLPKQTPTRPRPETGRPSPTGTVNGGTQNIINSKLLIYTKNGLGTSSTNTGGEFPSQLAATATVNSEFALQWSRTKPGKAEKANLYITPQNSTAWVAVQSVNMPAQSSAVNIGFSMPNLAAKIYDLKIVADSGSSSKVTINYTGNSGQGPPVVLTPGPTSGAPLQTSKVKVTSAKFTPRVGTINEPGYQPAKLTLTLEADTDAQIKEITVEVYSEPFMNSEILTASGSKNAPIKLFSARRIATYSLHSGTSKVVTITLHRTSKGEVKAEEAEPGIYSPGDWNIAFGQTTTGSFRWSVDGKPSGSTEQPLKTQWQWP